MIDKIARRAGGFASTTTLRWLDAGAAPTPANGSHGRGRRVAAGAAAGAVALLSSSKTLRTGLERGLRAASDALRATPSSNGSGGADLTAKTRSELYEMAKKIDLPGRSAMSKDELARALGR